MISDDEGVTIIQELLAFGGCTELRDISLANWKTFSVYEKENTITAHSVLCSKKAKK